MKLMIASDIHGSAKYCQSLYDMVKIEQPDKLLLLGDLLYHGPRNDLPDGYAPKEVIKLLTELKDIILCVRGNCEAEVDQMVLPFPCMADYALISDAGLQIYMTHGHHFNEENPPKLSGKFILLCGHTHISACREHNEFVYMNPGSVSIPKENTEHGYMIIENSKAIWKTLDGECYFEYLIGCENQ